jgi:hypothetical protein
MGAEVMESQAFDPKAFSLSPVEMIPPDDDDAEGNELSERQACYQRVARLVDPDDIAEMVCARLKDSVELRHVIEDAIADPHDTDRPRIHINDALMLAQDVLVEVVTAVNEMVSMLNVVEG